MQTSHTRKEKGFRWYRLFWCIPALAFCLHLASICFSPVADWVSTHPAALLRTFLGTLTAWIPFSLAETLLLALPPALVALLCLAVRCAQTRAATRRMLVGTLAFLAGFYSLFVLTLGCGYYTTPLDRRLGLAQTPVTAESLTETASWLLEETRAASEQVVLDVTGSTVLPLSLTEVSDEIRACYAKLSPLLGSSRLHAPAKPIHISSFFSYAGILGVYSFFTGEANVNPAFPDYCIPFTVAHEFAHQRGFAREDEANFVAFLVCTASEDSYVRYSGYMNMLEYVMNTLYEVDYGAFAALAGGYSFVMQKETDAYNAYYEAVSNTPIADVSDTVNDAYLKLQGTEGTISYSLVVELCVAWFGTLHP